MTHSQRVTIPVLRDTSVRPNLNGRTFALTTMGCKVNTFESEQISQKFDAMGLSRVSDDQQADIVVINTCTVTAEADRQARQKIRKIVNQNPDARVVVTGCYAQMSPDTCASIPGVDLVVGNGAKLDIPSMMGRLDMGPGPNLVMRELDHAMSMPTELISGFDGRARAFVQIQQGCDQGCTFCIIHTARGPNRSFSRRAVIRQCQDLINNGYRELVLCGVDIGSYGQDTAEDDLCSLVEELCALEGDYRIRLSSIDPIHLEDRLIQVIGQSQKICPQLHLSLQSGNTLILKRMKRRAKREDIYDRINLLRQHVPQLVISADVLVGFPTETDEQFRDTLEIIDDLDIAYPHVFAYSPREGTPAARIPRQVPVPVRKSRSRAARELGARVWSRVAACQIGDRRRVILEESNPLSGVFRGRSANSFPVDFSAEDGAGLEPGSWASVEITGVGEHSLKGVLIQDLPQPD